MYEDKTSEANATFLCFIPVYFTYQLTCTVKGVIRYNIWLYVPSSQKITALSLQVWSWDRCIYALSAQLFLPCVCRFLWLSDVQMSNNWWAG